MSKRRDVLMVLVALVAGLIGGVVSNWFLMGTPVFAQKAPQPEKVVQAERFELVDKAGKPRAVLSILSSGAPQLILSDQAGQAGVQLTVLPNGSPGLVFVDQAGQLRILLSLPSESEGPSLNLYDKAGNTRAELNLLKSGEPSLKLYDQTEKLRAALGYTELETIRTGATENRAVSSLMLFDKDGKVIWHAP